MSLDEIRRAYDDVRSRFPIHGFMDESGEGERAIAEALIAVAPARGRLLDIGAGPLVKAALFARLGFECYACDDYLDQWHRRDGRLDQLEAFAKASGIVLHVHENGDYTIPFPPDSFDAVCICDVIEHLHESPRDILNAAGRMLRPGGLLLVTMPNSVNLKKRLKVAAGRSNHVDVLALYRSAGRWRGHVREYTLAETALLVKTAGFEIAQARTFDRTATMKIPSPFARAIYRGLAKVVPTFRDSLLVIGRKPAGWVEAEYSEDAYRHALGDSVPDAIR